MKLPKSISPCPIKEAVAEIRFEATVPADAVFGMAYQLLKADFPKAEPLPIVSLPPDIRNTDKNLEFQPHYRLSSKHSVVLIGPKVISVGIVGEYPGWSVHSEHIKLTLRQFFGVGILSRALRFGLRYISFFPFDIFPKLLLRITVDETSLEGDETFFKTVLNGPDCRSLLQIGKGLVLANRSDEKGSVIDIDSFVTSTEGDFSAKFDIFLEQAHRSEKELFFRLLTPEFLQTLNPVYDNGN